MIFFNILMKMGSFHFVVILNLLFLNVVVSQQFNTDGYYLRSFLQTTGVEPGTYNFAAPVCLWQGVVCDSQQTHILRLTITGAGLTGPIPENSIGKLTSLEFLDLDNNSITELSSDMWGLSNLRYLSLSNNNLSGSLPNNIGNFGALNRLDLSENKLSGAIPPALSSLTGLHFLNLSHNLFNGSIPQQIFSCKSLVQLDLSSNKLTGAIPQGLGQLLPELRTLSLADNELGGQANDFNFSQVPSISYLNLSSNMFTGSLQSFTNRASFEILDLSKNAFTGSVNPTLWASPRISILRLNMNNLSGNLPSGFSSSLKELDVSNNMFEGQISQDFVNWPDLSFLGMSSNRFSGRIPGNLSKLIYLKHLDLAENNFSLSYFPNISSLQQLEYLNLSACHLSGSMPAEIFNLENLRVLDLSRNLLTGNIPPFAVDNMNSLTYLDFSVNNLTGDIPMELGFILGTLKYFNFSYNNMTICWSNELVGRFPMAFRGASSSCPIAANPHFLRDRGHRSSRLALALGIGLGCLLAGLVGLAFACRKKAKWVVRQMSYKEEKHKSGPFSFETDSFTWIADVKFANSVPVVMFEKPLLNITFADLLNATSHFNKETLLAEGRYGPVYRAVLAGGFHVAVKVLVHERVLNDQEAAAEFEYLGKIKHPNLVPLVGYCLAGDQRIAIYDFMENGSLHHWLHDLPLGTQATEDWSTDTWEQNEGEFSEQLMMGWRVRHRIALGTARALAFLHHGSSPPIVHRDVKASSIYLDATLEPHVADFGLANITSGSDNVPLPGAPGYVPPEYGPTWIATSKGDVYSFGVVLFELITGKRPVGDYYPESNEASLVGWVRDMLKAKCAVRAIDPKLLNTGSITQIEEALRIGYLCTADIPAKRPTMQQIVGLLKDMEPSMDQ
eukprot:Gb_19925 [translate_table: standard]